MLVLPVLMLFALFLRADSNDWGLPFRLHPDEWKYVSAGANCHLGEFNPKYFRNPPGFSYLNAAWYPLWLKVRTPVEVPGWLGINPMWIAPSDDVETTFMYRPFDLVLGGRALSALLGMLSVAGVFYLAREWLSLQYAFGAAGLAAVSFANVRECHFAVNDPAAACLVLWAMVLGVMAFRKSSTKLFYLAAGLCGAAIAFKYNMAPALLAVVGMRVLQFWPKRWEESYKPLLRDLVVMGLLGVLCFLLICPFPITDPETFGLEIEKLRLAADKPWQGQDARWSGVQLLETIWKSEGIAAALLSLAGLIISIYRKNISILLFPLLYGLLVCTHPLFFVRFSLPVLPWISVMAAIAVAECVKHYKGRELFATLIVVILFTILAIEPLTKDIRSNYLLKQTDTRIEFLHWIKTGTKNQSLIGLDQFSIPLVYRGIADFWTQPADPRLVYIDRLVSSDLNRLDSLPAPVELLVISGFASLPGHIADTYLERRNSLIEFSGTVNPIRTFSSSPDWPPHANDIEDVYSPFDDLWSRDRPGPIIEIFKRS